MIKKIRNNLCRGKIIQMILLTIITIGFICYNIFVCRVIHYLGIGMMLLILAAILYRLTKIKYVMPPAIKQPNPSAKLLLGPILVIIIINMFKMFPMLLAEKDSYIIFGLMGSVPYIILWCLFAKYLAYRQALKEVREVDTQAQKIDGTIRYFNKKTAFYSVVLYLVIWLFVGGLVDMTASVTSLSSYQKEVAIRKIREADKGIFPAQIPKEAVNITFYSRPPIWRHGPYVYLEFEITEAYIVALQEKYQNAVEKLETANVNPTTWRLEDGKLTSIFQDYVGKEFCEVYVLCTDYRQGYAIDRQTNKIKFFYFGEING
ncbi:MAG: hypothetical protein IJF07_03440 [Lachnospiraceae bacterium]|nr:hypothetical protein [Lachnospiraceae bacterium]